jgi:probable rRNA maturation factor
MEGIKVIEIDNRQIIVQITEDIYEVIKAAICFTLDYEKFPEPYEVSVVITDNIGIQSINLKFRKIDKITDVLSFPLIDFKNKTFDVSDKEFLIEAINPETKEVMLGDIVISIEKAISQAAEYNHSLTRELGFLTVHSLLHLLGYDHESDKDRSIMRHREEDILSVMKLTR